MKSRRTTLRKRQYYVNHVLGFIFTVVALDHVLGFVPSSAGIRKGTTDIFGALRKEHASRKSSSILLRYTNGNNTTEATTSEIQHGIYSPVGTNQKRRYKLSPNGAQISMVGSGPGSPDLLTVAAHRILTTPRNSKPNLIIADRLVSQEILDTCVGEIRIAKKYPGCAEKAQEEIYTWVEEGVREGRHVIRLKIGDPFVFGRGGEEVLRFREMGMEPNVIPVCLLEFDRLRMYLCWAFDEKHRCAYFLTNFVLLHIFNTPTGCVCSLLSTSSRRYPCHAQGLFQSSCHVHWIRKEWHLT